MRKKWHFQKLEYQEQGAVNVEPITRRAMWPLWPVHSAVRKKCPTALVQIAVITVADQLFRLLTNYI